MSGFLAILRTDGAPLDPALPRRLTESRSMALRGPDRRETWSDGAVALGHALLRTTPESASERQPLSLDGDVWIAADARIDARDDLIRAMTGGGRDVPSAGAPDAELILRAYLRWGAGCVDRLLGDFAFAIWDRRRRQLFCARDHMGVKPFYYAAIGPWLVAASTIDALRGHPAVSGALDDLAIADFLLFGANQDPSTTSFRDIRRLAPAHRLRWSASAGVRSDRYWTLPIDEPVYYRRDEEYVERFRALVTLAVADRLRTDRVGVFMSGGIDSSTLAAAARGVFGSRGAVDPVRAYTFAYETLIDDPDRECAGLTAAHLGIPIRFYVLDRRIEWSPAAAARAPEPLEVVCDRTMELQCYRDMASHGRVAFYGEGPDDALWYEWRAHLAHLWRTRRWVRLAADVARHIRCHRHVPVVGSLPRRLRERRARRRDPPAFPAWLDRDFVDRLRLEDRWRALRPSPTSPHPVRPVGYGSLQTSLWPALFDRLDPAYTGVPLEVRHPFVDLRLLRFMLQVPAMPWSRSKYLVRRALAGVIPEHVRRRPKTPLPCVPDHARAVRIGMPPVRPSAALARYGDAGKLSYSGPLAAEPVGDWLRFVALSHWLPEVDVTHGVAEHTVEADVR